MAGLLRSALLRFARELDFHEPLRGASDPKLENSPFNQDLSDITEFPPLALGNAFEFPAQVLANTQAYLSLPLAHAVSVSKTRRGREKETKSVEIPTRKR